HHPRMREPAGGVALELDSLLEVHQVELDLIRAAPQGEVGDEDMEQSGFARTGFAGDENVLPCTLAQGKELELGRARASDRDAEFAARVQSPYCGIWRGDIGERHLDAAEAH